GEHGREQTAGDVKLYQRVVGDLGGAVACAQEEEHEEHRRADMRVRDDEDQSRLGEEAEADGATGDALSLHESGQELAGNEAASQDRERVAIAGRVLELEIEHPWNR